MDVDGAGAGEGEGNFGTEFDLGGGSSAEDGAGETNPELLVQLEQSKTQPAPMVDLKADGLDLLSSGDEHEA